ncbi:MAG TPA: TetR/AcrR family transcriptional regulator [Bryobacteraceae bacterium]|jgi:AcrR family transcriptional regulator|nr:TetR/AcrR family transcriptional regulator [Bryobacteraceae bacterium]
MRASQKRNPGKTPVAKKQDRAILTRKRLTEAARRIFARDGFENARVEDIAAAAGKTRGAFYANFKDKEDVFFAIFEEYLSRDREQVSLRLNDVSSSEERIEALARHLVSVIQDYPRMMLAMEFKQYAIRHPRKQKRLADLHSTMCARCVETDVDTLFPEFAAYGTKEKRAQTAQIGAILEGLALNQMFDADILNEEQIFQQILATLRIAVRQCCG